MGLRQGAHTHIHTHTGASILTPVHICLPSGSLSLTCAGRCRLFGLPWRHQAVLHGLCAALEVGAAEGTEALGKAQAVLLLGEAYGQQVELFPLLTIRACSLEHLGVKRHIQHTVLLYREPQGHTEKGTYN